MQNHFELFHLPQCFEIDMDALQAAYREVQNRVHPDKFAHALPAEKRVAMQWATRANEAYQTLKNPLKRAIYLCHLHGADVQMESNTAMPASFLMQQMEWRETLADTLADARAGKDADVVADVLARLEGELKAERTARLACIGTWLDAQDFAQAVQGIRELMFLEKFSGEVAQAFEALES